MKQDINIKGCAMADVPPVKGSLQQQLECIVCRNVYNLEGRTPTALRCQHTFCKSCVNTLATKPPLTCPKCKTTCKVDNLKKNFAVCDILEKLCSSCYSREIEAKCEHCDQNLCATCLDAHTQIFEGDVKQNLDQLRQEVRGATELTSDESVLDKERTRAAAAIEDIQKTIQMYQDEVRTLEEKLNCKVNELKKINMDNHMKWQHKIDVELVNCKTFLRKSNDTFGGKTGTGTDIKSLTHINNETLKYLSMLQEFQTSTPTPVEYTFVASQSAPDVGEIISAPATSGRQPRQVDYTRARSIAVSGRQRTPVDYTRTMFADDAYVTCTDHSCIMSDSHNDRIKVYDKDLNLVFIFGEYGKQKHQFHCPSGLCVSPSGDLYVSDTHNHRVKMYDKYFQLVRTFGSEGSGNDEMNLPMGLAFTQTGQLLVADFCNYRVKVLSADGSYIRSIGSRGTGPGEFTDWPDSVASTPDGHVLVNERIAARLLMFTLRGDYVRDITPSVPNLQHAISIWGFTTDSDGNIIIADYGNHQLIVLDGAGQLMCVVGREEGQPGELLGPRSVAVNSNRILVYEGGNNRVQLFEI